MRILHAHHAALDADDFVGAVAELEDVAGQALDREILVHRADKMVLGLELHAIIGVVGDRAAIGDGGQPCAAPAAQQMIDAVVMQQRAAPAAPRREAFAQHRDQRVEIGARQRAVRPGAAQQGVKLILRPVLCRDFRDDLLGENIERLMGNLQPVELLAAHAVEQRRAFDEIVAREREQTALGRAVDGVARAPDALQEGRDRTRRAKLADQLDIADIDAKLQRGGRDERFQLAALEALFGIQALILGEAAVMRGHRVLAQPLGELARRAFRHAPRVDEDQRRLVVAREFGEPVVDRAPDLVRHHRFQRGGRDFQRQIARAMMAAIDNAAVAARIGRRRHTDQEARDLLDRLLRGRQADAQRRRGAELRQALQRQRQMGAALVGGERVDLVDDHRARGRQHGAAGLGAEQDVERFRRGDDDVRRLAAHAVAFARRRVAGAHHGADVDIGQAARPQACANAGQRGFEIALNVVRQRLERRDVDDPRFVAQSAREAFADQRIDGREKRRQRLA